MKKLGFFKFNSYLITKRFAIITFAVVYSNVIFAQTNVVKPPVDGAKYVTIDDANHDFGNIEYGKPVQYSVTMKNISEDTLALSSVIVSCGCTTPKYKQGLYAPGDTINMAIGFNGYSKGYFDKSVSILFQDSKVGQIVKVIRFSGIGIKKEESN